ncbi:hypothetical protein ADIAL_0803 [Alkalibacterium sp. AK22]|nr:hypothetical protein ADIAL_0803 [Alkalibacterium sp. AK22]
MPEHPLVFSLAVLSVGVLSPLMASQSAGVVTRKVNGFGCSR